jgi:predicted HAD superfamily Cof-like phosphohydrolase
MKKQAEQVAEFHRAFGHPVYKHIKHPPLDRIILRHNLIQEEVTELLSACADGDVVGVADAITDCMYILLGTAHEWGLGDKLEGLFDEVHRSNMSKLDANGRPLYREDGKVMKGDKYTPPDLKPIVWASDWDGDIPV